MRFSHEYHPHGLNNTLLAQGCVLEVAPSVNGGPNMHSKDRRVDEEPPIAPVWLEFQLEITYS